MLGVFRPFPQPFTMKTSSAALAVLFTAATASAAPPVPVGLGEKGVPEAGAEGVDLSPLPVRAVRAFELLTFERPILLTHAGDGSDRVFVASQLGRVYHFPNEPLAEEKELFFDLSERVTYKDRENEEGFLGMAFHPDFKSNGEFFVYYTTAETPHTSVLSRFTTVDGDPDKPGDPASEEELLRLEQPFWNHNGGTVAFGPDGMLYVTFGDGGSANDPLGNGQNADNWFGTVLRIDVDAAPADGKPYAIPADNPLPGTDAAPEVFAYGLRNPWRFSFDRDTGDLWLADVGQGLWEEINVLEPGGNYGWSRREGFHPFPPDRDPDDEGDLRYPVWEYHHDVGKSITGGHVYRGKNVPALVGKYLYADYVTGLLWGLERDGEAGAVVSNGEIAGYKHPVMSFGEDQNGEVYFMTTFGQIWTFAADADEAGTMKEERTGEAVYPFNGHDLSGWAATVTPPWTPEKRPDLWQVGVAAPKPDDPSELVIGPVGQGDPPELVSPGESADFATAREFGDLGVRLEFLLPEDSNSGVILMNRYEVQLTTRGRDKKANSSGAIYSLAAPPRDTPMPQPGVWHTLEIDFRAPRFEGGKKTADALFRRVAIDDATLLENIPAEKTTGKRNRGAEVPNGPFVLQGDHGPVSFRNIKLTAYE